jgi:hypothetical protein
VRTKGAAANPDLLSKLIAERIAARSTDFQDIVLSEAVQVVPRLTGQQISLLSFVHFVKSMIYPNVKNVAEFEELGKAIHAFSVGGIGLSQAQKQHLQYAGVASLLDIVNSGIFDAQNKSYHFLGFGTAGNFKAALEKEAPTYASAMEQFDTDNLFAVNLTSVGQAIALANISNYVGKLDYSIWLK